MKKREECDWNAHSVLCIQLHLRDVHFDPNCGIQYAGMEIDYSERYIKVTQNSK